MSIRLHQVRKFASHAGATGPLLDAIDLQIDDGARVAILGGPKSGKSTLLRLICGTEYPDGGTARREGRISWPIPQSVFLTATSTVATNIRFMSRLYGIPDDSFPRRIADKFGFGEHLNTPLKSCPKHVRPRLTLAIPLGIGFDTYLFEQSLAAVDKDFKDNARQLVAEMTAGSGYVLATGAPAEAQGNFDLVYVLDAGRVSCFPAADEGVEYFKKLLKAERESEGASGEAGRVAEDDGGELIGDIDVLGTAVASVLE